MKELRLKTTGRFVTEWFYFYEGQAPVKDGIITLPLDPNLIQWAQRAFLKGFREDPDTGRLLELSEILAMYEEPATVAEAPGADRPEISEKEITDGGQVENGLAVEPPGVPKKRVSKPKAKRSGR